METALTWDEMKMTARAPCSLDFLCIPVSAWSRAVLGPSKLTFFLLTGFMIYQKQTSQAGGGGVGNQTCAGLICVCNLADVGRCQKALCFGRWGCFLPGQRGLLLSGWKPVTEAEKTQCSGILCHLRHHELGAQGQVHCSRDNFFVL